MKLPEATLAFVTRVFGVKAGKAAKAFIPAVATLIAVGVQFASSGQLDKPELNTALTGLGAAVVTYIVPNLSALMAKQIETGNLNVKDAVQEDAKLKAAVVTVPEQAATDVISASPGSTEPLEGTDGLEGGPGGTDGMDELGGDPEGQMTVEEPEDIPEPPDLAEATR